MKASSEGLLLTDSKLTKFFRKHYSSDSISYCGYYNGQSGTSTEWTNQNASPEKIIGIVAKKSASNTCVLLKTDQTETSDSLIKYLSMVSFSIIFPGIFMVRLNSEKFQFSIVLTYIVIFKSASDVYKL